MGRGRLGLRDRGWWDVFDGDTLYMYEFMVVLLRGQGRHGHGSMKHFGGCMIRVVLRLDDE